MMPTDNQQKLLNHDNVLGLYMLYNTLIKDELGFFFQAFHFYISLLSAILAGTLTGLLNINSGDKRGLVLLIGPVLILVLSYIGYDNAQAFYRRFTEAWVVKLNLESMLSLTQGSLIEPDIQRSSYPSRKGGFIPQIEWPCLKKIFEEADQNAWSAEHLAKELVDVGTTLSNARWTFILFSAAAIVFACVIVAIVSPWIAALVFFIGLFGVLFFFIGGLLFFRRYRKARDASRDKVKTTTKET